MARTVLVTGAGTGIGRAVASAFAADGDAVVITGRRAETLETTAAELGGRVHPVVCDGTDPVHLDALPAQLPETVEVLVHCAGGNTDLDRPAADDLTSLAANWRANLEANLLSAVLTTAAVRDRLVEGGSVISIGSVAADRGVGSYGAAKAALASWNVSLAGELGPHGVTANVVAPGYIEDTEFFRGRMSDEIRDKLVAATSTGRVGYSEDVAGTVYFLASSAARHITGQVLAVNGGAHTTR